MITPDTLASLEPFAGVPAAVLEALARRARQARFAAGEVLFAAGDPPRGWFVVLEGRVRVMAGSDDRRHVVHTEGPGGTLGEVPLFGDTTHPATGIAAEPTRCAVFTRADLEAAIGETPAVAFLLLGRMAHRVRHLVERLDGRTAQGVQARLAAFLLARPPLVRTPAVSIGMTQQALAEELGTVREVVARELRALARKGLIRSAGGGRWLLVDRPALELLARP